MRNNRRKQVLTLSLLLVAVLTLSIGFAAFSSTLNISSTATITPNSDSFSIKFSTTKDTLTVAEVAPSSKTEGITATNGEIDNTTVPVISNLSAEFKNPGDYVSYTFYVRNEGEYLAYLNSITFLGTKACTAEEGTSQGLVDSACASISLSVTVGTVTAQNTLLNITGETLTPNEGKMVTVLLQYDENGTRADGPFSVTLQDVSLYYASIAGENEPTEGTGGGIIASNFEAPELYNNTLTPVVYNGSNWVVANSTDSWYDYSNQQWANAVILRSDVVKSAGDTVTVEGSNPEVLGMYVWIPRYEYKIEGTYGLDSTDPATPGAITINFINESQTTATDSSYRIHPAFTFGDDAKAGIWVGKFEPSHTTVSAATTYNQLNCTDENCSNADGIRVLPNVKSVRNNDISNFFYAVRSMSRSGNAFGISSATVNTHIMKNGEWAAVAYLTQSVYGKYGNSDYTGVNKEIYQNKSSEYITGASNGTPSQDTINDTQCEYDSTTNNCGIGASTTGNIYGIYDMSGGAWEYVMGVFANSDGVVWSGSTGSPENAYSGFTGPVGESGEINQGTVFPAAKYYDVFKASSGTTISSSTACNGGLCYGHALDETVNWYGDTMNMVKADQPWFARSRDYNDGVKSGLFYTGFNSGGAGDMYTARIVFTAEN